MLKSVRTTISNLLLVNSHCQWIKQYTGKKQVIRWGKEFNPKEFNQLLNYFKNLKHTFDLFQGSITVHMENCTIVFMKKGTLDAIKKRIGRRLMKQAGITPKIVRTTIAAKKRKHITTDPDAKSEDYDKAIKFHKKERDKMRKLGRKKEATLHSQSIEIISEQKRNANL